ncbi:MAG TPA: glycosyltransferase [Microthrixaceae bacterium]|nr:glycosyltransferase [Microthrixaceae bacterium]HMT25220.1 glycosyltransferase [Microthrixaceae bacterium]HMT60777.1 glycosyltransferase [Microthrixaceae bacterium]
MSDRAATRSVSVVVPTLNGAGKIEATAARLDQARRADGVTYEVILVDDGSVDDTWAIIRRLCRQYPGFGGLRLRANVGQIGATLAGFSVASGDVLVMMDDDLDVDPRSIPRLLDAIADGADFASGTRSHRRSVVRDLGSHLFNRRVRSMGMPFTDTGCGMNAMTRRVAERLIPLGWAASNLRFKPSVHHLGVRVANVDVEGNPTKASHYRVRDLAAAWLDVEIGEGAIVPAVIVAAGMLTPVGLGYAAALRGHRAVGSVLVAATAAPARVVVLQRAMSRRRSTSLPFEILAAAKRRSPRDAGTDST